MMTSIVNPSPFPPGNLLILVERLSCTEGPGKPGFFGFHVDLSSKER